VGAVLLSNALKKDHAYDDAVALMDAGQYEEAIAAFEALEGYKDSAQKIELATQEKAYFNAVDSLKKNRFEEAIAAFTSMDGYRDSLQQVSEAKYLWALHSLQNGLNHQAHELLTELASANYKDSASYLADFIYLPSAVVISGGEKILCDYDSHGNAICGLIKFKPDYSIYALETSYTYPNEPFKTYPVFDSIEYTYNEDGSYIRECGFTIFNSTVNYKFSYNPEGQCTSLYRSFSGTSSSSGEIVLVYHANGQYRKMTSLANGNTSWVRDYTENGTFTSTNYRFPMLNDDRQTTVDSHKNILNGDDDYRYTYDYDETGNLIRREVYQGNIQKMYVDFSYDQYGNMLTEEGIDLYGKAYLNEFAYEYDYFYCPDAA